MQSRPISHPVSLLHALLLGASFILASAPLLAQPASAPLSEQLQAQSAGAAARRDFAQFAQHHLQTRSGLPAGFPLDVNDVGDLKDAKIGRGFQVYTIDPGDIVAGRSDFGTMVKASGVWRFFIMLNERPIGLATLEQVDGKWETVAYGGAVLSKDLEALTVVHGNAQASNLRFIRIFQAQSDFLEVRSGTDAKARYAPLQSAREALLLQRARPTDQGGDGLIDAADFLEPLRAAVKSNMATFR
ncbi:hypothetical protein AAKU55_005482 [Oxalobacteraceae bacterium GrIS 1.11]